MFANPVPLRDGTPLRTVLGGTGIAVSAGCGRVDAAMEFCAFVAGRECQTHLYGMCGGQPASRGAWQDRLLNQISNAFFERTVASIESAYVRPRYPGYIALQRSGGEAVRGYLRGEISAAEALRRMDELYRSSVAQQETMR
jgi:multiple sugar transport system substrate-binding protein